MGRSRNRLIGSIGVAVLVAGALVVSPTAALGAEPTTIQVLGINDFHGRIKSNGVEAGAAVLAGAVNQLRSTYPDTVFAAAGDLIGASTFESFIAEDKPTIDALNAAGLEVSAVGNHEFDQGFADLTNRVMAPYDAVANPFGGANWQYLGANVRNSADNSPALPETWIQDFGDLQVGFVGAVTDHLPELVSPAGIEGLTIEAPVLAANRAADEMKAAGVDIVVLLVHEGAATTDVSSATDPASDMGKIVNGADENIDAIVSGHTHLAYNHAIEVPQWQAEGRSVTTRPVVSAGQYGYNLNQLLFSVDSDTGEVLGVQQAILPLTTSTTSGTPPVTVVTPNYPADASVQAIVDKAVADAAVLGAVELGQIQGPFNRAKLANGTTENRGGESTLGNLVADAQRAATASEQSGSAKIAFMNPGGLRQDMVGNPGGYPAALTYQQAAVVQPFANTLVNMSLTGAQIRAALEQQWQPAGAARPFLRLGISKGFSYTYDPLAAAGSRITTMSLDGEPVTDDTVLSVTVNSFLASGGDNFAAFATGTNKKDTGQTDLQAMVDYMAENTPVPVDFTQRSVGVTYPADAPEEYQAGDQVEFALSSLAFSTAADVKDTSVSVKIGSIDVGQFPVDNTIGTDIFDEYGKAAVSFTVPAALPTGTQSLTITGNATGTTVTLPITVNDPNAVAAIDLSASANGQIYGSSDTVTLRAVATRADGEAAEGTIEFRTGDTVLATAPLVGGVATAPLPAGTPAGVYSVIAAPAGTGSQVISNPIEVTVDKATSQAILLATRTSYRQYAFLPAIMIAGVGLNNGQRAQGQLEFTNNGAVVARVPVTHGLAFYILPRSLGKGTYRLQATFLPTDSANISGVASNYVDIQIR